MIQSKTILKSVPNVLKGIDIPEMGEKQGGKVRDYYVLPDKRVIVTTDRQSAFDFNLGYVPFKGAVLNQLAAFWFQKTKHIIPNHLLATPDPNVSIAQNCEGIPVEMIVRGYMTGVTVTAIWPSYQKGERVIYGLKFPDGLKKNDKLPTPVITPTTHGDITGKGGHDARLTREEIIKSKIKIGKNQILTEKLYAQMEEAALALFQFGSKLCAKQGLILVDTKYEFGLVNGKLVVMDEIHTPDSSRFWKADTYARRIKNGMEPENFDKEFLRLWYRKQGYTEGTPPPMSEQLIVDLSQRYIAVYETITGKKFKAFAYPIEERIRKNVLTYMGQQIKGNHDAYAKVGVNYSSLDPAKKLAQKAARDTAIHLEKSGFAEVSASRGEAAFVWKQGKVYMASVTESLGTKNLVADEMRKDAEKTYYDVIGHDTIATALNDLTTVGAKPLVVTAFWAVGKSEWFDDLDRTNDLVNGWKGACDLAGATWGGGESPSYNSIVYPQAVALGGNVVGIITSKKRLLLDAKLQNGDRILLLKSNGINANGLSMARSIAKKLPKGYATKLPSGTKYGEALLTKTNIYAAVIQELLDNNVEIHYISNITGHGLRKIMRATREFTYTINKLFEPQEVFTFMQKHSGLSEEEMYGTFNMGQDYAIFLPKKDVKTAQQIIKQHKLESLDAGYIEKGERKVIISPKNIVFKGETLDLR